MNRLIRLLLALVFVTAVRATSSEVNSVEDDDVCLGLPNGNGLVAHPTYCAFFYFCNQGESELMECPSGLYFNPLKSTCDYPNSLPYTCDGGTHAPNPTTVFSTTKAPTTFQPTQTPEPEPTLGSSSSSPVSETPVPEPTLGSSTVVPTPGPGDLYCPPEVEIVFKPYPKDCSRFYECKLGTVTRMLSCSTGLWFREERQACMTPWTSPCPN